MDNPTYYDPEILGFSKEASSCQKRKDEQMPFGHPATLTKMPALRRWKLDFRAAPKKSSRANTDWGKVITICILAAILLFLLSGVAVIAHMAVQSGMNFRDMYLSEDSQGSRYVDAHFRIINRNYVPELRNSSSPGFRRLESELRHSLDVIFMDSNLLQFYNTTNDYRFRNGSVVVDCTVLLKQRIANAVQRVGLVFVEALEKGKGILPPGIFYVDVHTIRFDAKKELKNAVHAFELRKGIRAVASWSRWTEWSSCLSSGGICDGSRVRIRRRECKSESRDESSSNKCSLKGEDVAVQTESCVCPVTTAPQPFLTVNTESAAWSEWGEWSSCADLNNRCDPRQVQRRNRNCVKSADSLYRPIQLMPTAACSRENSETGIQLRLCSCLPNGFSSALNDSKVTFVSEATQVSTADSKQSPPETNFRKSFLKSVFSKRTEND